MKTIFKIIHFTITASLLLITIFIFYIFSGLQKPLNNIVLFELILALAILLFLLYGSITKNGVTFIVPLLVSNLFFMLVSCIQKPVIMRNTGFHDASLVPIVNPLAGLSILYCLLMTYITYSSKNKKLISTNFSYILYGVIISAILLVIYLKISSADEIQEIIHFKG
ncbi:hypothetical protein [Flavobacterium pedocola]